MFSKKIPQQGNGKTLSGDLLSAFDFHPRTRLIFGADTITQIGELARQLGAKKVLVVTDPGIVAAGHAERVYQFLRNASLDYVVFDKTLENPTTNCVSKCLAVAKKGRINLIIGLGGGSAMDTAKGCNFLLTNGGRMQDYWGVNKATEPMLPLIAIPTTSGTGSECQSAALITDEETHQKMACLDVKAAARIAILDPVLTLSQPPRVTACTGIDAIAHALETAVTTKRNPISSIFSQQAFALLAPNFERVLKHPDDLAARGKMLLGAAFAGTAIENSMLGAAHAAANPLTAHYGIVHGQAVGIMLPHVLRFNAKQAAAKKIYGQLAEFIQIGSNAESLIRYVKSLLVAGGFPTGLAECGVERLKINPLALEAEKQWTRNFNPRPIVAKDFKKLYAAAL